MIRSSHSTTKLKNSAAKCLWRSQGTRAWA